MEATFGAPVVRIIGAETRTFPLLRMRQVAELLTRWQAEDHKALNERLTEASATPEQRLAALETFAERSGLLSYGWRAGLNPCRAWESIAASIGPEAAEKLPLNPEEVVRLAAELWGAPLTTAPTDEPPPKGGVAARPTAPTGP